MRAGSSSPGSNSRTRYCGSERGTTRSKTSSPQDRMEKSPAGGGSSAGRAGSSEAGYAGMKALAGREFSAGRTGPEIAGPGAGEGRELKVAAARIKSARMPPKKDKRGGRISYV